MTQPDARHPQACDVPTGKHSSGLARLYPCGWRCANHAPRVTPVNTPIAPVR